MVVVRPDSASRRAGSAATSTALSWLMAWVRALTAESLAIFNTPQHLHRPVTPALALPLARPLTGLPQMLGTRPAESAR